MVDMDAVEAAERRVVLRLTGRDADGKCSECGALVNEEHLDVCRFAVVPAWLVGDYQARLELVMSMHAEAIDVDSGRVVCVHDRHEMPCPTLRAARGELEREVQGC